MFEFLASPEARVVLLVAATASLIAIGVFAILKFRPTAENEGSLTSELMTDFRELHSRGNLSDEEFRTIKTVLRDNLRHEIEGGAASNAKAGANPPQENSDSLE